MPGPVRILCATLVVLLSGGVTLPAATAPARLGALEESRPRFMAPPPGTSIGPGVSSSGPAGEAAPAAAPQEAAADQEVPPAAPLAPRHETWLTEEVTYIVTDLEAQVFRELPDDASRDRFIERFWDVRDPTPGTARNEVREEHYRRIEHANRYLGRETPRPGWQTDRGRVYIQLGEPSETQSFPDPRSFYPLELWFYRSNPRPSGLPPFFYVMFYRPAQTGEFRLYDPLTDGPQALSKNILNQLDSGFSLIRALMENTNVEVAQAAINLNPSEPTNFRSPRPSAGNAAVLRAIEEAPQRGVDVGYARQFLAATGEVDAEVTFDRLDLDLLAVGLWDERGVPFLHVAAQLPAEEVLIGQLRDDYYLSVETTISVRDLRGTEVVSVVEPVEQHFDQGRADRIVRAPLAYLDRVDLVPGVYDLSLTFRNRVTDDTVVARARVVVPGARTDEWMLGDLVVARRLLPLPEGERRRPRAFRFAGRQLLPLVEGRAVSSATLMLFVQAMPPDGLAPGTEATVRGFVLDADGNEVVASTGPSVPLEAPPTPTPLAVTVPLEGTEPGVYSLRLVAEVDGRTLAVERPLEVVRGSDAEPEILLAPEPDTGTPAEYRNRGLLYLRLGDPAEAARYLRAGVEAAPADVGLRRTLVTALMRQEDWAAAARELRALQSGGAALPGDLLLLSEALVGTGSHEEAATVARGVVEEHPTATAWTTLARALEAGGDRPGAIQAYEASLKLQPDQPEVREVLQRLRGGS